MPHSESGEVVICKYAPSGTKPRDHFSRHFFVGGNVLMLRLMQANMYSVRPTASYVKLEDTKRRTLERLQHKTARLQVLQARRQGDQLAIRLQVQSLAGHKFPAGFPSRRAWIYLQVKDALGNIVFESGRPQADGSIAGDDADKIAGSYEPHFELIDSPEKVQIYEAVMGDVAGNLTHTLLRAANYLKDNRLLPEGFNKETAPAEIGVYGKAANDADFIGGGDRIDYNIALDQAPGPFSVTATLYYTTISYNFIQDLFRDAQLPRVAEMRYFWERTDKSPVAIMTVRAEID
jgi:hypothetical protein